MTDVTERRNAEEAFRESEERYRILFEQANDGITVVSVDGRLCQVNEAFARMHGYSLDEARNLSLGALDTPDTARMAPERMGRILAGEALTFEVSHIHKDGRVFPVEVSASLISCGGASCVQATYRDITARRQADNVLRESELKYRSLIECSSDAIFCVDEEGRYQFTNRLFASAFGKTPDYFVGKSFWDVYPKEHADQRFEVTKRVFRSGESESVEVEVPLPGNTLYFYATANPIRDETGRVVLTLTHAVNITDRKRAEEALRESEAQKSAILNGISTNIALVDRELKILWANKAAARSVGRRTEEMVGHSCYSLWGDAARVCASCPAAMVFQTGRSEHRIMRSPDGRVWDEGGEPVFDTAGNVVAVVEIAHDITERERAQEALGTLHAELEQRVRERTAALTEANREMEAFSYSVSHDLRAPVRAIDGFAKLLEEHTDGSLDDEGRRLLATVRKNSLRMGHLIDDLLAFSRAGRSEFRRGVIDLGPLVHEVLLEVLAGGRHEQVEVRVAELPPARGDRALVRQVFLNLLVNAVKFSAPKANPVIEIGSQRTAGAVEYFVRDNGVGFDQKYAGKLFGVFQRLHSERDFPGTGIGLSLVRRIVERHGGCVRAEGEVGRGATFWFTLGPG